MEEEVPAPQPTPTKSLAPVITKELAKKRLRAFQLAKQANTSRNPSRPVESIMDVSQDDDSPSTASSSAASEDIKKKKSKGRQ